MYTYDHHDHDDDNFLQMNKCLISCLCYDTWWWWWCLFVLSVVIIFVYNSPLSSISHTILHSYLRFINFSTSIDENLLMEWRIFSGRIYIFWHSSLIIIIIIINDDYITNKSRIFQFFFLSKWPECF